MTNRWINVQSESIRNMNDFQMECIRNNIKIVYIGASIRPVFQASLNTTLDPPKSKVPLAATIINAPNIETVCITSVQT